MNIDRVTLTLALFDVFVLTMRFNGATENRSTMVHLLMVSLIEAFPDLLNTTSHPALEGQALEELTSSMAKMKSPTTIDTDTDSEEEEEEEEEESNDNNVIESLRSRYYNLHCGLLYKRDDYLLAAGREK